MREDDSGGDTVALLLVLGRRADCRCGAAPSPEMLGVATWYRLELGLLAVEVDVWQQR